MTADPTPEALSMALWQAKAAERVDEYVARGRRLAALSEEHLRKWYATSHKDWVADPQNLDHCRDVFDADAEFQLRGQDPPFALVVKEIKAMQALAKEISERIRASPTLRAMFESELRDELEPIARKLLDPKAKN